MVNENNMFTCLVSANKNKLQLWFNLILNNLLTLSAFSFFSSVKKQIISHTLSPLTSFNSTRSKRNWKGDLYRL